MMIRVGPFQLTNPIGRGGMGRVWAGLHVENGLTVAVKVLTERRAVNPEFRRAFFREARAMAGLDHPNIVTIFDYGEIGKEAEEASGRRLVAGTPYLAMEFANRGTLGSVRGHMDWHDLKVLLLSLLDALAHAHARGILHKDLKPANILLGDKDAVKLTDFGLAHALESEERSTDTPFQNLGGTPAYMAPEQFEGDNRTLGPATDLYSFGCLAWSMTTGSPPYGRQNWIAVANGHLHGKLPAFTPVFPVPDGLDRWLQQLLHKAPEARYQRSADAAWALLQLRDPTPVPHVRQEGVSADDGDTVPRSSRPSSSRAPADRTTLIWGEVETLIRLPKLPGAPASATPTPTYPLPPLPLSWETPTRPTTAQLVGTGLRLYSLRNAHVVGREAEQDLLWQALRNVRREGRCRVVVLHGPSGVGKSRLAQWLCERAEELGAAVTLRAQHSPFPTRRDGLPAMLARHLRCFGFPRSEVSNFLRDLLLRRGDDDSSLWVSLTDFCAPASKAETRSVPRSSSVDAPAHHAALLTHEIARICATRPVVVWLDDVQWGREALDWVQHLLGTQAVTPLPVLVLMTVRDDLPAQRLVEEETLQAILDTGAAEKLRIGPLAPEHLREFLQQLLCLEETLATEVEARTAGNPMFARQLVGDWVERGLLTYSAQGFSLLPGTRRPLPDDLHAAWSGTLLRLLTDLPETDGQCLEVAAALGHDVDKDEWRAVCKREGIAPSGQLMEKMLLHRLAWTTLGLQYGWSFIHAMLRECIERRAAEAGRLALHHRSAADHLATLADDKDYRERRARHLLAAGAHEQAVELLLDCARTHLRRGDHRTAHVLLTDRDEALETLKPDKDDPRLGAGWVAWSHLCRMRRRFDEAERWALKAEAQARAVGADQTLHMALREQALLANLRGRPDEAWEFLEKALEVAEDSCNDGGAAGAISKMGWVRLHQGHIDEARRFFQSAVQRYEAMGAPEEGASAWMGLYEAAREREQYAEAESWLNKAKAAWEAQGSQWGLATVVNNAADLARLQGRIDEAEAGFRRAVVLFRQLGLEHTSVARVNLSLVLIAKNRWEEAQDELMGFLTQLAPFRRQVEALAHCCLLPCLAHARDWAAWDHHADRALEQLGSTGYVDVDIAATLEMAAGMAIEAEQTRRARPILAAGQEQWRRLGRLDRAAALGKITGKP